MPVPLDMTPCKPATAKQQLAVSSVSDKLSSLQLDDNTNNTTSPTSVALVPHQPHSHHARSKSLDSDDEDFEATVQKIVKTAHKLQEENGDFAEEPLLKANPHRFVLFPIQDNEVFMHVKTTVLPI